MAYTNVWTNSTAAATLNITTAPTAGRTLLAWKISDSTGMVVTWPTGFTQIATQDTTTDGQTLAIAIKPSASGAETTLALTSGAAGIGGVIEHSGRDTTTPQDVTTVVSNNNTGQASPWTLTGAITPVTDGVDLVAFLASDVTSDVDAVHTFADTVPLTWTTRADIRSTFQNVGVGTATQTSHAATTVTGTGAVGGASAGRSMMVVALRPAASAALLEEVETGLAMCTYQVEPTVSLWG